MNRRISYLIIPFSYGTILFFVIAAWFTNVASLYIGRDALYSEWLAVTQFRWANPFDVTTLNPFAGMGSMLLPVNPWFNPGVWPLLFGMPHQVAYVISTLIYFLEFTVSTYILARSFKLSSGSAFVSSWIAGLITFPPFNFAFGLQGWVATGPFYGNSLSLGNLMIALFLNLGTAQSRSLKPFRQIVTVLLIDLVGLTYLLSAPFWNGGLIVGYLVIFGAIFLSSFNTQSLRWRTICVISIVLLGAALDLPTFYLSAKAVSARFNEASAWFLPTINWSVDLSVGALRRAQLGMCAWGLFCDTMGPPFGLIGSKWMLVLSVVGGLFAALRERGPLGKFAAAFTAIWLILILYWWALNLRFISPAPSISAVYFYFPFYPILAVLCIYALSQAISLFAALLYSASRVIVPKFPHPDTWRPIKRMKWLLPATAAIVTTWLCVWLGAQPTAVDLIRGQFGKILRQEDAVFRFSPTPSSQIVDYLKQHIALSPGRPFAGSVATLLGLPGSPLRAASGLAENQTAPNDQFEKYLNQVRTAYGNAHSLGDLWEQDIPTLEEYGQAITIPLRAFDATLLGDPRQAVHPEFLLVHRANLPVLEAAGVRFVVTDSILNVTGAKLRIELNRAGVPLRLYELEQPNLATYSPIKLLVSNNAQDILAAIDKVPTQLSRQAYVGSAVPYSLVPTQRSQMTFIEGGVHITGESEGASALLLPLQFSHCFVVRARSGPLPLRFMRANVAQSLLIFEKKVDVDLIWKFNFWRHADCRRADVADIRALGL